MSINYRLPKPIQRRIRELCDDENFEEAVWGHALVYYHDMRQGNVRAMSKDEAEAKAVRTLNAVRNLQQALRLADYTSPNPRWTRALTEIEEQYTRHLETFKKQPPKKNWPLEHTAMALVQIFDAYSVDRSNISGFLKFCIKDIEPHYPDAGIYADPPGKTSIENAVKAAREAIPKSSVS